jgi:hypothetical protein
MIRLRSCACFTILKEDDLDKLGIEKEWLEFDPNKLAG